MFDKKSEREDNEHHETWRLQEEAETTSLLLRAESAVTKRQGKTDSKYILISILILYFIFVLLFSFIYISIF